MRKNLEIHHETDRQESLGQIRPRFIQDGASPAQAATQAKQERIGAQIQDERGSEWKPIHSRSQIRFGLVNQSI